VKHNYTIGQNLRYFLANFTCLFQIFATRQTRPMGISVMIRVHNEDKWIAKSLLSLNDFADEVVIVNNNSTDNTLVEIENIKPQLKFPLIIENETSNDICEISNHALSLTSYHWIFRWDSDFIAHTSGRQNIKNLRELLLNLNLQKYYLIFPLTVSFAGDLFHVKTGKETNSEAYIHSWHPKLKYVKKGKFEVLKAPFFYKIMRIPNIFFVHIGSAKPISKLLRRFFWLYWQNHLDEYADIDGFIKHELTTKQAGMTAVEFVAKEFKRLILPVRKYEKSEFGDYPELMKNELLNPEFTVNYF